MIDASVFFHRSRLSLQCLLALLVGACAHGAHPKGAGPVTTLPDDGQVIEQVLARLDSLPWSSEIRLADPGLLGPDPSIDMPTADDFLELSRSEVSGRVEAFRRMGVDTTSLVRWEECRYRLPDDPLSTSCPSRHITILTIARARPASARFPFPFPVPQSEANDPLSTKPGDVAVRLVLTRFSPDGRRADAAIDLILTRGDSAWRVTAQKVLAVIH